ncbi:hypothetical protein J2X66_005800 [Pseudomonas sp. 3296]|jgi:hypothetical protein|nr:hypothetical protein [Pseudomonas sp. 3296]
MRASDVPPQGEQPKKRSALAPDTPNHSAENDARSEVAWLDVGSALDLLNSMTRKSRTKPAAKPLERK